MNFSPNKTPIETKEGAFGGTYFRDIYSGINKKWYKKFMERICSVKKYWWKILCIRLLWCERE